VVRGAFAELHVYPMYNKPSKWRELRSTPQLVALDGVGGKGRFYLKLAVN
jgi:hypothetical protein